MAGTGAPHVGLCGGTNWSRDASNALSRWLSSEFTCTALYQPAGSISANA
jgi:hypothetical protein